MTEIAIVGLIAAVVFIALIPRDVWTLMVWLVLLGVSGMTAWICLLLLIEGSS